MKKIIGFLVIVFYVLGAFGQETTTIDFYIGNKRQELNNNFNVYFVYLDSTQKIIYKPQVYKNKIIRPSLLEQKEAKYYILIKFKNKVYTVTYGYYSFNKNVDDLIIYFEKKPYKKEYFWEQWDDESDKSIKGGIAILFSRGDAVCRFKPITDFGEYFKQGEELLKIE